MSASLFRVTANFCFDVVEICRSWVSLSMWSSIISSVSVRIEVLIAFVKSAYSKGKLFKDNRPFLNFELYVNVGLYSAIDAGNLPDSFSYSSYFSSFRLYIFDFSERSWRNSAIVLCSTEIPILLANSWRSGREYFLTGSNVSFQGFIPLSTHLHPVSV